MSERRVALFDPGAGDAEAAAVERVIRSNWLAQGPATAAFEAAFAARLGVPAAVAVSSGTAALHLALLIHGIGPGDEVITPSLTFVACPAMIAACGATPVFADIVGESDLCLSPADVELRLTPRTRAVVAMHYGGHAAAVDELLRLCERRGVLLLEDAAHAPFVAGPNGSGMLGTIGAAGCFSLHVTKNVAAGEGGVLVVPDPERREAARRLRSHGLSRTAPERLRSGELDYDVTDLGYNYRPTELASAVAMAQLEREPAGRQVRRQAVAGYRKRLGRIDGLEIPFAARAGDSCHHLFVVLLPPGLPRRAIVTRLRTAGIEVGFHYPPAHLLTHFRKPTASPPAVLPRTEAVAPRLLSLPMHARLQPADVAAVCDALEAAIAAARRRRA